MDGLAAVGSLYKRVSELGGHLNSKVQLGILACLGNWGAGKPKVNGLLTCKQAIRNTFKLF